jgi:hypothetical protein
LKHANSVCTLLQTFYSAHRRAWSDSSGLIGPEHEGYRTPRRQLVSTKQVKG